MSRYLLGCTLAGALALSPSLRAQDPPKPQPEPTRPPAAAPAPSQDMAKTVTVEGCLVREADVPGRKPNITERAGVAEDFILTSTKIVKGSAPSAGAAKPGDTPTGTSGTRALMYEVEGIDNDNLKQHAGKRVQIEGTFENAERAAAQTSPTADLVQLRGTVIRPATGDCPAK